MKVLELHELVVIFSNPGRYTDQHVREVMVTANLQGRESRFGLSILGRNDLRLVILSELHDNPGTSVTNMIEILAQRLLAIHPTLDGVPADKIYWVEHYSDDYYRHCASTRRAFDFNLVEFDPQTWEPYWRALRKSAGNDSDSIWDAISLLLKD